MKRSRVIVVLIAAALAVGGSLPLFGISVMSPLVLLGVPGMFASMVIAGNVHAFSAVLALIFNLLFYIGIGLFAAWLIDRFRHRNEASCGV